MKRVWGEDRGPDRPSVPEFLVSASCVLFRVNLPPQGQDPLLLGAFFVFCFGFFW